MIINRLVLAVSLIALHFLLCGQGGVSGGNSFTGTNTDSQESAKRLGTIKIKPLYIPDPNGIEQPIKKDTPTTPSISESTNQPGIEQQQKSNPLKKPVQWMLESSMRNAPELLKGIVFYLQSRTAVHCMDVTSFHRFILVGPPGTGKTTLAHAIADMLGYSITFIPATSLLGKFRNDTAVNIRNFLHRSTADGRNRVIIIDELHKLFEHYDNDRSDDSQSAATFWLTLDEIATYSPNVIIIGTANNVDKLPPEIKSRFSGKVITVSLPDKKQKIEAFKNSIMNDVSVVIDDSVDDAFIESVIEERENCSLRDVQLIIDTAKMFNYASRSDGRIHSPIILTRVHFQQSLNQLQAESQVLQESMSERVYKNLQKWGLILSVLVNVGVFFNTSIDLVNKVPPLFEKYGFL